MPIALKHPDAAQLIVRLGLAQAELERVQAGADKLVATINKEQARDAKVRAVFWTNPFDGACDRVGILPDEKHDFDPTHLPLGLTKMKSHKTVTITRLSNQTLDLELREAVARWRQLFNAVQPDKTMSYQTFLAESGLPPSADREQSDGRRWHNFPSIEMRDNTVFAIYMSGELCKPPTGLWQPAKISEFYLAQEANDAETASN